MNRVAANAYVDVPPFEHIGRPARRVERTIRERIAEYRDADEACRRAMEGPKPDPEFGQ